MQEDGLLGRGCEAVARWARRDSGGAASALFLVASLAASLGAPLWAPYGPLEMDLKAINQGPSVAHWLGTDNLGRDVLVRLGYGGAASLGAAILAVLVSLLIGVPIGLAAGYFGGVIDEVGMRLADAILSFPAILLAIAITGMLGAGLINGMIAVGVVFFPVIARIMRAQVLSVREELYVRAARSFGASHPSIVFVHILPNSVQPVIVQTALLLAFALLAAASLSFLGLGIQPPNPEWGAMLGQSYRFASQAPLQILWPGLAITATALAFNVLGESLRRTIDPKAPRRQ